MQWLPLETAWLRLPEGLRVPSRDKGEEHKHMYGFRANGTIFIRGHTQVGVVRDISREERGILVGQVCALHGRMVL